jgi:hypothetical protein
LSESNPSVACKEADRGVITPESQYKWSLVDGLKGIRDVRNAAAKGVAEHYLHFPRQLLQTIRDEARSLQPTNMQPGSQVSSLDVFTALITKLLSQTPLPPNAQAVDLYYTYSLKPTFPDGTIPTPYLHNLYVIALFPFASPPRRISKTPTVQLALQIRERLVALRTPPNTRAQLVFHEAHKNATILAPRREPRNGWVFVTSWKDVFDGAVRGFGAGDGGEKLVFFRPRLQYLFDLRANNTAISFEDGEGGVWARVDVLNGEWKGMWDRSGLGDLLVT